MAKENLKSLEVREALVKKLGKKYVPGFQDFMIMELTTDIGPLAAGFDNNMNKTLVAMAESTANGYFDMKDKYVFVSDGFIYSIKAKEYKKYIDFCYDVISDSLIAHELKIEIEKAELSLSTFGFSKVKKKEKHDRQNNVVEDKEVISQSIDNNEADESLDEYEYEDYGNEVDYGGN